MKYQTTNLQPIKRYPTYQFHADTAQKNSVSQVFCICVLETLRWRAAACKSSTACRQTSAPRSRKTTPIFPRSNCIRSAFPWASTWTCFTWKTVDCGRSICLNRMPVPTSAHPENVPAVNGRIFETDISFLMHKERVEVGIRTIALSRLTAAHPVRCSVLWWFGHWHRTPM